MLVSASNAKVLFGIEPSSESGSFDEVGEFQGLPHVAAPHEDWVQLGCQP